VGGIENDCGTLTGGGKVLEAYQSPTRMEKCSVGYSK
jgi:hypothetical protein